MFRHADVCLCLVWILSVLNVEFYMAFTLLILVEDARGDHMEEEYYRAGLMTALYVVHSEVQIALISAGS